MEVNTPADNPRHRVIHQHNFNESSMMKIAAYDGIGDNDSQEAQEAQTIHTRDDRWWDVHFKDSPRG